MRDQRINIHKSDERYRRAIEDLKLEKRVTEHDRKLILSFLGDLQAEGISELLGGKHGLTIIEIASHEVANC